MTQRGQHHQKLLLTFPKEMGHATPCRAMWEEAPRFGWEAESGTGEASQKPFLGFV